MNIIIGFSTVGDMYAAKFPNYNFIADAINSGYWQSCLLVSNFTAYAHLEGTSLISIQYNVTFGSSYPVGCTANYCLAFYDLTLLTKDPSYPSSNF